MTHFTPIYLSSYLSSCLSSILRRRCMSCLLSLAGVGGLSSGLPRHALAAESARDSKTEARDRFSQGLRLFEKGENAAALAEFKRAYELIPNPVVLYNIGLVYAAMDRPVEALDALDAFLAQGGAAVAGQPGTRARQVRAEQAARIAEIDVVTNKPATLEVDGVEVGRTPLARPLRVTSGAHVLAAQAPGCLPAHKELTLAGQVKQTVTFDLLPTEASVAHVTLTVSVPGAEVLVAGKRVGTSPLPASVAVPPGEVRLEARRPGYLPASQTVRLDEGASGAVALALEEDPRAPAALKGRLRLVMSAAQSSVLVDGHERALGEQGLALPAGPHVVHIGSAGFEPYDRTVEVVAEGETAFVVDLVPTPETKRLREEREHGRRVWGWSTLVGGVGVAAGSAIYAAVTRHDIAHAQQALAAQLAVEAAPINADPANPCSASPILSGYYENAHCADTKAGLQDDITWAKVRRDVAFGGVAVGVLVAAAGTYLLATKPGGEGGSEDERHAHAPSLAAWSDGRSGGLTLLGQF